MKLETLTKIACYALYSSVISIVLGLIVGMLGKLSVMIVFMGIGAGGILVFEMASDHIDKWYAEHEEEKY